MASGRPGPHVPGEPGLWVFIFGDLLVFTLLFGAYLYERADAPAEFRAAQAGVDQNLGALNTVVLLTSSLLVVLGFRAMQRGDRRIAPRMFAGAIGCALVFGLVKYVEYRQKLDAGITPSTNDFWMYYFTITGLHLAHVVLGTAVLAFCLWASRARSAGPHRLPMVEGGACYWHMVDLLWIVIFPLLYLAG